MKVLKFLIFVLAILILMVDESTSKDPETTTVQEDFYADENAVVYEYLDDDDYNYLNSLSPVAMSTLGEDDVYYNGDEYYDDTEVAGGPTGSASE